MKKIGRPVSTDPSNHRVTIRFTDSEYQFLKQYADTHNLTISQVIKQGIAYLHKQSK